MKPISDVVGNGPIEIRPIKSSKGRTNAWAVQGTRRVVALQEVGTTVDNGPAISIPVKTRGKTKSPLNEMYSRCQLGISEPENRRNWQAAERLKRILEEAEKSHAPLQAPADDWWDICDWRETIDWAALAADPEGKYRGIDHAELPGTLGDDRGDDEDAAEQKDEAEPFDNLRFNIHRDLPPAVSRIHAKQVIALAAETLESDYPILIALIQKGWTASMIGETQGYAESSATARACGMGMLRNALRKLDSFFVKLDRLENGAEPTRQVWRLVGTPLWLFDGIPKAWTWRKPPEGADNDNKPQNQQATGT